MTTSTGNFTDYPHQAEKGQERPEIELPASNYDTLAERRMDLEQQLALDERAMELGTQLAGKAKDAIDQLEATQQPGGQKNASTPAPRRPRPIVCIADGCLCSFLDDEALETLKREDKPIGCATL